MNTNELTPRRIEVALMGHARITGVGRLINIGNVVFLDILPDGATEGTAYNLQTAVFSWRYVTDPPPAPEASKDFARTEADKRLLADARTALRWAMRKLYKPSEGSEDADHWRVANAALIALNGASIEDDDDIPF